MQICKLKREVLRLNFDNLIFAHTLILELNTDVKINNFPRLDFGWY